MWTLKRAAKGPDQKWRLNKESKYSSLFRTKKKQEQSVSTPDLPPPPFPPPLDTPPDLTMIDPRMINLKMMDQKRIESMERMMYHNYMDQRSVIGPRKSDPGLPNPRINSKLVKPNPGEPQMFSTQTLDNRSSSPRPLSYPWFIGGKQPSREESNSSESEEELLYHRTRSRSGWTGQPKRDGSIRRRSEQTIRDGKGHHGEADLRTKPLQDLNGREKHVERFLASLQVNGASPVPVPGMEMVSRQRILSRSKDDLVAGHHYRDAAAAVEDDEDVWFDLDTLVKEHVHEILRKWEQIDDGIWAKAIVFEKNRRVAKAYLRPPILTVNASDIGFDGHRIGLRGFDNPMRDAKTLEVISRYVGPGVKIRMDNKGNIEVKKLSEYNVYAKPLGEESAISDEICKTPNLTLDSEKQMVFDIQKFEQNVNREVRKAYPNRAKLENQCIMALAFYKPGNILQCPSWVMIINIVAMDMLRSRLPIGLCVKVPSIKNRPRLPVPEEDPYAVSGAGSGASSGGSSAGKDKAGRDKPPKLPPRDNPALVGSKAAKGDYDSPEESIYRRFQWTRKNNTKEKDKDRKYDDPYYCGLRARIPNFAKQPPPPQGTKDRMDHKRPQAAPHQYHLPPHQLMGNSIYHSRSVDSGMAYMQQNHAPYIYKFDRNPCSMMPQQPVGYDSDFTESPYSHIYGRLPLSNRAYLNPAQLHPQGFYGRDWD